MAQRTIYVDPARGQDSQGGSSNQPLKTLTAALQRSQGDTVIRLAAGIYSSDKGEQFPLMIPPGCRVVGTGRGDRPAAILRGSGALTHPTLGTQSVACVLASMAELQNMLIMNTQTAGIGLWLEDANAVLQKVVVMQCPQYGVLVLGAALPTITNSQLEGCGVGIGFLGQGKGQLTRVIGRANQVGIAVEDTAAPLIQACLLEQNATGIAIADTANPVLRNSRVSSNKTYGIRLTGRSTADLGQPQDPGNNVIRRNGQADIQNDVRRSLIVCGNDVVPQSLKGRVELVASELPDTSAIPAMLFEQPASQPTPDLELPDDTDAQTPEGSVLFRDLANDWAGPFVDGLAQVGAVAGFGDETFRPTKLVSRAEFAAFALASFPNRPATQPPSQFSDVPAGFWAEAALKQAQTTGFLSGFPDGTMRPQQPITRIQAIVAVTNGLGFTGGRVDDIAIYRDRAQVPSYAVDALATATQRRLVVNHPDPLQLRPLEPMTRGEVSALMYQGQVAVGQLSAIASPYIVQPDTTQPLFTDLSGHWATDFVRGLAEANLVSGLKDGRFAPDAPMNRAQFAALIVNAFQPAPERSSAIFRDVPPSFWASDVIQTAYRGGFLSGFPDRTFEPNHPLVRVQVWVSLVNGLDWEDPTVDLNPLGRFDDYTTLPRYALQAAAIAAQRQLILSYPDTSQLRPNQVASRGDVCAAVYQALVALERLTAIASRYVV